MPMKAPRERPICAECGETIRRKRDVLRCNSCGAVCCPRHAYYYVDGNSGAITRSARPACREHHAR